MALLTALKGKDDGDEKKTSPSRTPDDGPPPSSSKPKPAQPKGSLFQQSSANVTTQNSMGLGPEGGDPQVIANQALSQVLTGIKTLSTVLPGLVPVLSDLTGRLSMLVPQMMNDMTNGGSGLVPSMGMPLPQPGGAGMMGGMPGPGGPGGPGGGMPGGMPGGPGGPMPQIGGGPGMPPPGPQMPPPPMPMQ